MILVSLGAGHIVYNPYTEDIPRSLQIMIMLGEKTESGTGETIALIYEKAGTIVICADGEAEESEMDAIDDYLASIRQYAGSCAR